MIQNLKIKNFQIHKETEMEFSPGINVITGSSDEGKSTIIRAIKWCAFNTPRGKSFLRNGMKKNDECSVSMMVNANEVIRKTTKSNSVNQYVLNETEKYDAVRSEVPQPVQEALNLSSTNIQPQHEFTFLLSNTPGEVAKKLNDVIGVDIIDNALKYVDSLKRKTNSKLNHVKEDIVKIQGKIDEYENVDHIDGLLTECENIQSEISELDDFIPEIDATIHKIKNTNSSIREVSKISKLMDSVNDGMEVLNSFSIVKLGISNLNTYIINIPKTRKQINNLPITEMRELVESSSDIIINLENCQEESDELQKMMKKIKNVKESVDHEADNHQKTKAQLNELKQELEICPLCERNL